MNRLVLGIFFAAAAFILGIGLMLRPSSRPSSPPPLQSPSSPSSESLSPSSPSAASRYIEYSPASFAAASDKRRVLYFYANWCPTCRPADREFQQKSSQIPADVVLFRVNYNDSDTDQVEKNLAVKYGVTYQHTFIQVDYQDRAISTWNGGDLATLLANLKTIPNSPPDTTSDEPETVGTFKGIRDE